MGQLAFDKEHLALKEAIQIFTRHFLKPISLRGVFALRHDGSLPPRSYIHTAAQLRVKHALFSMPRPYPLCQTEATPPCAL